MGGDFKEVIMAEDLDVNFFITSAKSIAKELEKKYSDFGYIDEKIRNLTRLRELACRAEIKRARNMKEGQFPPYDDPEVQECIKRLEKR